MEQLCYVRIYYFVCNCCCVYVLHISIYQTLKTFKKEKITSDGIDPYSSNVSADDHYRTVFEYVLFSWKTEFLLGMSGVFIYLLCQVTVWIMVAHFQTGSSCTGEAAKIDGCSTWGTLWRIIFPIAAPGVFTTAIMTFISAWNEYLLSCTMNSNESIQTVPVRIGYLRGQYTIYWNQIAAAAVVVVIPTLVMVLLFQKQIVAGIANGAVKE